MLRRRPFSLPRDDQAPLLAALLRPDGARIAPPDPRRLADAAIYHHVAGYTIEASRTGRLELPPAEARRLADWDAIQVIRSKRLRRELALIAPALDAACGAPALAIKGPAVADRYYPDRRLRPFADLDLLVPRDRLPDAVDALREVGYEPLDEFRAGFSETYGHDVHLVRRLGAHAVDVDLHWRIGDDAAGTPLDHELLGDRAVPLEVEGVAVAVPATPHQLLVLALHFLSDRAKRLAWVHDLRLVADVADDSDWDEAFELAEALGLSWVLHRALDYAAHHLALDRPRPRPPGPAPAWGPVRAVEELDVRASTHIGRIASLGWRGRASYIRTVLVPTRAGLRGTVGGDGAPTWRLAARHASRALAGLAPRRR